MHSLDHISYFYVVSGMNNKTEGWCTCCSLCGKKRREGTLPITTTGEQTLRTMIYPPVTSLYSNDQLEEQNCHKRKYEEISQNDRMYRSFNPYEETKMLCIGNTSRQIARKQRLYSHVPSLFRVEPSVDKFKTTKNNISNNNNISHGEVAMSENNVSSYKINKRSSLNLANIHAVENNQVERRTSQSLVMDEERHQQELKKAKYERNITLYKFLIDLLDQDNETCVMWISRETGMFKIVDSDKFARMWGEVKFNPSMNYEKLARSFRHYYKKGILESDSTISKIGKRKLFYKFSDDVVKTLKK